MVLELFDWKEFDWKEMGMWLGKLFGGQKRPPVTDPDDEPARFLAPMLPDATGTPADFKARLPQKSVTAKPPGFDPYNSGSFKKKDDAWVRVGRR
jgi:hypothetical protein